MITTVTTTTTTTLNSAIAGSLGLMVTFLLISLLLQQEIISSITSAWALRLRSVLKAAIIPLMAVFAVSVAMRLALLLA